MASKYKVLGDFLRTQVDNPVAMTFEQIEGLVGPLPPSHRYRAWWSNNATNSVMTKVWRDAGFRSEQVDLPGRRLVFRRLPPPAAPSEVLQPIYQPSRAFAAAQAPLEAVPDDFGDEAASLVPASPEPPPEPQLRPHSGVSAPPMGALASRMAVLRETAKITGFAPSAPEPKAVAAAIPAIPAETGKAAAISARHPQFGALKGLIRVTPGAELVQPADPEWGERL